VVLNHRVNCTYHSITVLTETVLLCVPGHRFSDAAIPICCACIFFKESPKKGYSFSLSNNDLALVCEDPISCLLQWAKLVVPNRTSCPFYHKFLRCLLLRASSNQCGNFGAAHLAPPTIEDVCMCLLSIWYACGA
jgi:hypothetical protein